MGEFFKPWRTRVGVVMLVTALAIVGLWGWSQDNYSSYSFSPDGSTDYTVWLVQDFVGLSKGQIVVVAGLTQTNIDWWIKLSHWSIALPLSLLSAFLLLAKPRKSNRMKIAEPVPNEGT